jgi:hypothetical protein
MTMTRTHTHTVVRFEVVTKGGVFEVKAKDQRALDDAIERGLIFDAEESFARAEGWRVNMAHVIAYRTKAVRD